MSSWTEGYQESINYSHGYYPHLNPLRLHLSFLNAGLVAPPITTACELGFGQGESINLHAAASTTLWFGTDFNAAQAGYAQELASASGAAARIFDQSFVEFCNRADLPEFDFIALHGVWSWISDQNRGTIVDFVRRKLKAGGVVYISYNTPAAHAAFIPMRDVLTGHAELMTSSGLGVGGRIDAALDFAGKLLVASPSYAQANPEIAKRLNTIRGNDPAYVAHEYFNRDWLPTSFSRMSEWLAPAKLEYACPASYFDMVDAWNLSIEQQALLNEIPDTKFREMVRDIMVNKWFRRDYWVKGARQLSLPEKVEGLRNQRVILTRPILKADGKAVGSLGSFLPSKSIYDPILDALADYRPKTLRQIEQAVKEKGVGLVSIVEVVLTLLETSSLSPAQDDVVIRAARKQTDKLNAYLCDKAPYRTTGTSVLASPVIGAGLINVGRVVQFFWHAMTQGKKQPNQLAAHASQIFRADITILEEEKHFISPDGNLESLNSEATYFIEKLLPLLKALHIL
jgi:hypothetical protein